MNETIFSISVKDQRKNIDKITIPCNEIKVVDSMKDDITYDLLKYKMIILPLAKANHLKKYL